MREYSIQFGSREIKFHLEYNGRKTLGISISPDMEVTVKAPNGTSLEKVKEKVKKRAPWILKQESYFLTFQPKTPPRKYVGGESHLYLGRRYTLRVRYGKKDQVHRKRNTLEVTTRNKKNVKSILLKWYRQQAKTKFAELAEPLIQKFSKYIVEPRGIYLHSMPTRWGSCTPGGKIILNPELIKAPKRCIEYVIIHELCHLVYRDHTRKFFDLQSREMRDWQKWKDKLERIMV